jgi:hypothetical protein
VDRQVEVEAKVSGKKLRLRLRLRLRGERFEVRGSRRKASVISNW